MQSLLPTNLPNFAQKTVLVIGDIMLDKYWFGDTSRISPEAPVPIIKITDNNHRPGGAGNVALNIAALGAKVILIGIIGKDEAANLLIQQLEIANVHHDLCVLDDFSTIVKLRVISRHQQLLRLDFEETHSLSNSHAILLDRYRSHLTQADLVILSDYQKGALSQPDQLIALAKSHHIPVLVDPKGNDFAKYSHATILTPNLKEFETIVGPCHSEEELIAKGQDLLKKYQLESLLVTRGEDGMTLLEQNTHTHLPAYSREVFDVTGAGDTVIGVLGASVASGMDLLPATALANLAASLTIAKLGAASINTVELQAALTGKMNFNTGIVNEDQLLQAIQILRQQGKKIAFTNGCFDIIHAGHVSYLQAARKLADYLIVAVNTDDSIRQLKGSTRPINHLEHRMIVLSGLEMVDWVIPFADHTPERLLQLIQPDLLIKGGDYSLDEVVGADLVRAYGGEIRVIEQTIHTSSSSILHRLQPKESN